MRVNLSALDWCVIAAYLGGILALGLRVSRGVTNSKKFFVGNRAFGKTIMIAQTLGTGTHSDQAVGVQFTLVPERIRHELLELIEELAEIAQAQAESPAECR